MNEFTPKEHREETVDPEALARTVLVGREHLLWAGQPIPRRMMTAGFLVYPFALLWTGFSIFWVVGAYFATQSNGAHEAGIMATLFPFFGVPFIIIGLVMLAAPFIAYNKAKKTVYGITDKRAFIKQGKKTKSYPFAEWKGKISSKERKDKSGGVFFAKRLERTNKGRMIMRRKGFMHIENVKRVEERLRRALDEYNARKEVGLL